MSYSEQDRNSHYADRPPGYDRIDSTSLMRLSEAT